MIFGGWPAPHHTLSTVRPSNHNVCPAETTVNRRWIQNVFLPTFDARKLLRRNVLSLSMLQSSTLSRRLENNNHPLFLVPFRVLPFWWQFICHSRDIQKCYGSSHLSRRLRISRRVSTPATRDDRAKTRRIIYNILGNLIKPKGGREFRGGRTALPRY